MYKFIELLHRLGNNNEKDKIIPEIFFSYTKMCVTICSLNFSPMSTAEKIESKDK